jgi:hypothetical protein
MEDGEWKLKMENGGRRMGNKKIENGFWKLIPFSIFNFSIEKKRPGDGYCEIRFKTILAFTCW